MQDESVRAPDLRQWNIIASSAVSAATACGPGTVGENELGSETSTGDSDGETSGDGDGDVTGDGDGETTGTEPECSSAQDCPPGHECSDGECWYQGCSPYDYDCWRRDYCLTAQTCDAGYFCDGNQCSGYAVDLLDCVEPPLVEIPLPPAVTGPILDLQFADIDGDARDELVLLKADALLVIDDDQLLITGPFDPAGGDQLAVLRVDADQHLDVVIGDRESEAGAIWLGAGDGSFASIPGGPGRAVDQLTAIDWPSGGGQELAARAPHGLIAWVISTIEAPVPTLEPFAPPSGVEDVAVARFGDGADSLVTSEHCQIMMYSQIGGSVGVSTFSRQEQCTIATGDLFGDAADEVAVMTTANGFTFVVLADAAGNASATPARIPGEFTDLARVRLDGLEPPELLLIGAGPPRLVRLAQEQLSCSVSLTRLPAASDIAKGDFDGDSNQELALLDQRGLVRMWSAP